MDKGGCLTEEQKEYVEKLRKSRLIGTDNYCDIIDGELPVPTTNDLIIWALNDIQRNTREIMNYAKVISIVFIITLIINILVMVRVFI